MSEPGSGTYMTVLSKLPRVGPPGGLRSSPVVLRCQATSEKLTAGRHKPDPVED